MSKLPGVRLEYALLLDSILLPYIQKDRVDWTPPEREEVLLRVQQRDELWREEENLLLQGLCDVTGLQFFQNVIDVFFVTEHRGALSTPLIIGTNSSLERFNDILTHELIHRLLNDNTAKLNLRQIQATLFPDVQDRLTRNHILVHAIHKAVYLEVLNSPERLEKNWNISRNYPGYKESWDIVDEQGYKKLIADFQKHF